MRHSNCLHACIACIACMYCMHVGLNVLHVFSSLSGFRSVCDKNWSQMLQNGRFLTFYQKSGNLVKFSALLRISKRAVTRFFEGKRPTTINRAFWQKKGHISIPISITWWKWFLQGNIFKINIVL